MSAKLEWTLIAALGVAFGAVYYASLNRPPEFLPAVPVAAVPASSTAVDPSNPANPLSAYDSPEPVVPPLPWVATTSLSNGLPTSGMWRGHPALADMNNDGKLDILASIRRIDHSTQGEGLFVFSGDGAGNWSPDVAGLRRDMGYGGIAVSDINRDGHLDLAFSGHDVIPHVFLRDPQQDKLLQSWSAYDLEGICADVALGDLDGDGDDDLASVALFSEGDGVVTFKGNGTGVFEKWQVLEPAGVYGYTVDVVDIDGDGRNELLAVTSDGLRVWSFGAEGWQGRSQGFIKPDVGGSELDVVAVDLDGDNYKELIQAGMIYPGHAPLRAWRWDGSAWAPFGSGLSDGEGFFSLALANLGPGSPVSVIASGAFGIQLIQLASPGQFVARGRLQGIDNVLNVACGDIDGDGRDEVICLGSKGVTVLRINDKTFASATPGAVR